MKKTTPLKRCSALALCALLTLSLTACGSGGSKGLSTKDAQECVQVELDTTYKGQFAGFVNFYSNVTTQDAKDQYNDNIAGEAAYFLYLISMPDAEDQSQTIEPSAMQTHKAESLYKDIYAKSDYTIVSSSRQNDGTFAVKVNIKPMDILTLVSENWEDFFTDFDDKFSKVDTESMTDEEFFNWWRNVYVPEYYDTALDLLESQVPNIGYADEKSIVIQVQQSEEGALFISEDDWTNLDALIIDYSGS